MTAVMGDLGGFSGLDELLIKRSTVFVEPASDERRHIKGLAKESPAATNICVAFP